MKTSLKYTEYAPLRSNSNQKTTLSLIHEKQSLTSKPVSIKSGTIQEDSLSPLFFRLALASLSCLLNKSSQRQKSQNGKLPQLFYIDELKTPAKDDNEQKSQLNIVKTIDEVITMELEIDKYAKSPTNAVKKQNKDQIFRT